MEIRLTHAHRSDRLGRQRAHDALENAHGAVDHAIERFDGARGRVVANVKPKLRGWIHAGTAPLALAAGIVLIALTPAPDRWASAVFVASSLVLFGTSAVYHRGTWSPRVGLTLRRLDHSNIFLLIAGTYTPLAWMLLDRPTAQLLLAVVWGGAIVGILMRVFWLSAPRWLYVPLYIALGWVAVWFLPAFSAAAGPALVWLIAAGGIAYTLGAVVYGFKRPNPSPRWFGFHEIFHVGTVIGFLCHLVAVFIAVSA
jgi:hemolysin III